MRHRLTPRVLIAATLVSSAAVSLAASYTAAPLVITFAALADSTRGITGGEPYVNRAEGKVPVVMLTRDGLISLDTRRSTRTVCFAFGGGITVDQPAVAPKDGCYPVLMHTLIRPGAVGIPDLADGETLDFGMDTYWTGPGADGVTYDYVVEFKRVDNNGVDVTYHASQDAWDVSGTRPGRVSVYRRGKTAGWSVVGHYDVPVHFTAVRGQ
jgi:hypothetical protein